VKTYYIPESYVFNSTDKAMEKVPEDAVTILQCENPDKTRYELTLIYMRFEEWKSIVLQCGEQTQICLI